MQLRVSTCPTIFGEKVVIRILKSIENIIPLTNLGLNNAQQKLILRNISKPQGIIFITGPTGSGKTSTLYSILNQISCSYTNIVSIEDPVEIPMQNINQVNVNKKIGICFASILKTFLRQDPDVIIIGEIREIETAKLAFEAAQTGHLIISTLHTNTAIQTLLRLKSLDINANEDLSNINLIINQRLARKLCNSCKIKKVYNSNFLNNIKNDLSKTIIYEAKGCSECYNGYKQRIGIFEAIYNPFKNLRFSLKNKQYKYINIPKISYSLKQDFMIKIKKGITTIDEFRRVL